MLISGRLLARIRGKLAHAVSDEDRKRLIGDTRFRFHKRKLLLVFAVLAAVLISLVTYLLLLPSAARVSTSALLRGEAYVALASSDYYAKGVLVIMEALKKFNTKKHRIAFVTEDVTPNYVRALRESGVIIIKTDVIEFNDVKLMSQHWRKAFTKLKIWTLDDLNFTDENGVAYHAAYSKLVWLDADILPLENIDDVFDYLEAGADGVYGVPDNHNCKIRNSKEFCSGLMVLHPNTLHYLAMKQRLETNRANLRKGDQQLIAEYFKETNQKDSNVQFGLVPEKYCPFAWTFTCRDPNFKPAEQKTVHFAQKWLNHDAVLWERYINTRTRSLAHYYRQWSNDWKNILHKYKYLDVALPNRIVG